jgi:hypothetical protein
LKLIFAVSLFINILYSDWWIGLSASLGRTVHEAQGFVIGSGCRELILGRNLLPCEVGVSASQGRRTERGG